MAKVGVFLFRFGLCHTQQLRYCLYVCIKLIYFITTYFVLLFALPYIHFCKIATVFCVCCFLLFFDFVKLFLPTDDYFLPCHVVCCFFAFTHLCLFASYLLQHLLVCRYFYCNTGSVKKEDESMFGSVQRQVKKTCVCVLFSSAYCFTLFVVVC